MTFIYSQDLLPEPTSIFLLNARTYRTQLLSLAPLKHLDPPITPNMIQILMPLDLALAVLFLIPALPSILLPPAAPRDPQHSADIARDTSVEHPAREHQPRLVRYGERKGGVGAF